MILKRYGNWYHTVTPNFNPTAMTEIGFMRDREFSIAATDFENQYRQVDTHNLAPTAESDVQRDAERTLLANLETALNDVVQGAGQEKVVLVCNDRDDWPKTREARDDVIVDGKNRFHFRWAVDPPLKLAVYARAPAST